MTYNLLMGMLNPTHSHSADKPLCLLVLADELPAVIVRIINYYYY